MAKKKKRGRPKPAGSRRTLKRGKDTTPPLERGGGPTAEEQIDASVDSPSEVTAEGGPGTDAAYPHGGPVSRPGRGASRRRGGTGGEGGYSTLGGGVYP